MGRVLDSGHPGSIQSLRPPTLIIHLLEAAALVACERGRAGRSTETLCPKRGSASRMSRRSAGARRLPESDPAVEADRTPRCRRVAESARHPFSRRDQSFSSHAGRRTTDPNGPKWHGVFVKAHLPSHTLSSGPGDLRQIRAVVDIDAIETDLVERKQNGASLAIGWHARWWAGSERSPSEGRGNTAATPDGEASPKRRAAPPTRWRPRSTVLADSSESGSVRATVRRRPSRDRLPGGWQVNHGVPES